jgi:hypothetical protein
MGNRFHGYDGKVRIEMIDERAPRPLLWFGCAGWLVG